MAHTSSSRKPAHEELSDVLRRELVAGKYELKTPLPTETMLCERFGASRFTVRQALATLVVEGLIYRRPGSGTFPTSLPRHEPWVRILGSVEDALAIGEETSFHPEHPLRQENNKAAAERLRLEGDEVWALRGARYLSDMVFGYWQIFLPPEVGVLLGEGFSGTEVPHVIGKVKDETGAEILRAEQLIFAERTDARVAEALEVEIDSPTLRVERLYFNQRDEPLEWSISKYRSDRYNYKIDLFPRDQTKPNSNTSKSARRS